MRGRRRDRTQTGNGPGDVLENETQMCAALPVADAAADARFGLAQQRDQSVDILGGKAICATATVSEMLSNEIGRRLQDVILDRDRTRLPHWLSNARMSVYPFRGCSRDTGRSR